MYNSNFFFQSIIRETVKDAFTKQTDFQNMIMYNKWKWYEVSQTKNSGLQMDIKPTTFRTLVGCSN